MELWRVLRALEEYVANPVLRRTLASPLHWPFSRWFCLLSYEGVVSGDRFTTPVGYSRTGDVVHVVTIRERSNWWKNFDDPHEATLYLHGEPRRAEGEIVTNAVKHENHVLDFLRPAPALAGPGGEGSLDDIDFTNYVLVEFLLDPDTPNARARAAAEEASETVAPPGGPVEEAESNRPGPME